MGSRPGHVPLSVPPEGWRRTADTTEQVLDTGVSVVDVEGYSRTVIRENRALRDRSREGTLGRFDATVMQFFASRVALDPALDGLPFGVGLDELLDRLRGRAEETFVGRLRERGLTDPRVTDRATPGLKRGRTTTYAAACEYGAVSVPVADGGELTIPAGSLPVRGLVSVRKGDDGLFVAGGACPGAHFAESFTRDLTGAISVTVDVDFGVTPDDHRREPQRLTNAVH